MQATLCDPYLSALSVRYYKKCAIYIHLPLPLGYLGVGQKFYIGEHGGGGWLDFCVICNCI